MSKDFTNELVNTLNELKKFKSKCDNDLILQTLFNEHIESTKDKLIEEYKNEYSDIDDNDICKRYIIDILRELNIDVN